jgi:hypothetical protein
MEEKTGMIVSTTTMPSETVMVETTGSGSGGTEGVYRKLKWVLDGDTSVQDGDAVLFADQIPLLVDRLVNQYIHVKQQYDSVEFILFIILF